MEMIIQVVQVAQIFSQCYNLRSLHALGLLLSVSGILRFWLHFQPLTSLLFNWLVCILLECVAVEIVFQIPWKHLKLQNVTWLRYFVFILLLTMGLVNIYSMLQLCMDVRDCVLSHQEYGWMTAAPPLLWLAMTTAMSHSIVLAICVPVQVIIIPLECNKDAPNINFRSRNVTLVVNLWLLVHFVHLCINYFHYQVDTIALCYRLFCTVWMMLYCYPEWTWNTYHSFKRCLPDCIRPFLRLVRDRFVIKVWRNLRTVIKRRIKEENIVDNGGSLGSVLWVALYRRAKFMLLLLHVLSCIMVSCLLKYYTGWDITLLIPTFLLYLILRHNFYEDFADIVDHLRPTAFCDSSCFVSCSDDNSFHDGVEKFEMQLPIQCSELE